MVELVVSDCFGLFYCPAHHYKNVKPLPGEMDEWSCEWKDFLIFLQQPQMSSISHGTSYCVGNYNSTLSPVSFAYEQFSLIV